MKMVVNSYFEDLVGEVGLKRVYASLFQRRGKSGMKE